jgi:hypothetical protein
MLAMRHAGTWEMPSFLSSSLSYSTGSGAPIPPIPPTGLCAQSLEPPIGAWGLKLALRAASEPWFQPPPVLLNAMVRGTR